MTISAKPVIWGEVDENGRLTIPAEIAAHLLKTGQWRLVGTAGPVRVYPSCTATLVIGARGTISPTSASISNLQSLRACFLKTAEVLNRVFAA